MATTTPSPRKLAEKVWHLRVFPDDAGTMNVAVADAGGQVLVVSQFTLYGNTERGRRPSWVDAAPPEQAEPLVGTFTDALRDLGAAVATGRFGADMQVELVNDGPVTLLLEVGTSRSISPRPLSVAFFPCASSHSGQSGAPARIRAVASISRTRWAICRRCSALREICGRSIPPEYSGMLCGLDCSCEFSWARSA